MLLRNAEEQVVGSGYNKHEAAVWCNGYLSAQNHVVVDNSTSTNKCSECKGKKSCDYSRNGNLEYSACKTCGGTGTATE